MMHNTYTASSLNVLRISFPIEASLSNDYLLIMRM